MSEQKNNYFQEIVENTEKFRLSYQFKLGESVTFYDREKQKHSYGIITNLLEGGYEITVTSPNSEKEIYVCDLYGNNHEKEIHFHSELDFPDYYISKEQENTTRATLESIPENSLVVVHYDGYLKGLDTTVVGYLIMVTENNLHIGTDILKLGKPTELDIESIINIKVLSIS